MLTGYWVRVTVQIPAGGFFFARGQGVNIGQRPSDLLIAPELGIARDQDKEAVGVRPDAASRQRRLDRLFVTPQMIKNPSLVGEPGRGPGIAGTEAPPRLDGVERFFVAAVQAQPNAKIKMSDSEVPVELDRPVRVRYRGRDVSSPMACLGEHIFGIRVFTIERQSLKGGFACLTHEWSEVLYRPVIPLHDQRAGKPKMGVREVGIERKRLFEQAIGSRPIGAGGLVHMP